MVQDLMTIRADRDVYYFGFDALFTRHRDVINKLCMSDLAEIFALRSAKKSAYDPSP